MNSFTLFFHALTKGHQIFFSEKNLYLRSFIGLSLIGLLGAIPFQEIHPLFVTFEIVGSIIGAILSLIFIVDIILIEKGKFYKREKENLLYGVPTYLIYTFYSTLLLLIGPLLFLAISEILGLSLLSKIVFSAFPGLVVGLLVVYVPLTSVLIDSDSVNYFKFSFKMTKNDFLMAFLLGFISIVLELLPFAFELIKNQVFKSLFLSLFAFLSAYLYIIFTIASVKIYFTIKARI
jgi:hypothetical protein